jgi:hypothetical protein
MKIKTSKLQGAALDWAVAKCEGLSHRLHGHVPYSTDWAQGGPIIEKEKIDVVHVGFAQSDDKKWVAMDKHYGPTPLIAAMLCYVASQLGDEVDAPDELMEI